MSNLTRFTNNGLELLIDTSSGEVFANQNAIARMCSVSKEAIRKWVAVNQVELKQAKILTNGGLQGVNLFNEDVIFDALAKYNPSLLAQCAKAGLRVYLHGLAGYKYEVKKELSRLEILEMGLASEKRALAEEKKNKALQAQIEADKPKVEFAEAIQHSDTSIDIGSFAKNIGTGRNRLFRIMRDLKIIMQSPSTLPYQRYIDAGYFEVSQEIKQTERNSSKLIPFTLVTPKGQLWLHGKVKKAIAMEDTMAISIVQGALNL